MIYYLSKFSIVIEGKAGQPLDSNFIQKFWESLKLKSFENSIDNIVGLWEISDITNDMKFALIVELVQLDFINATVVK